MNLKEELLFVKMIAKALSYTQREKYSENTKKGARGIEIGQVISGIRNWVSELAEIE